MFGKRSKMSSNDRAIMALGRKVGNLKGTNYPNKRGPAGKSGKETIDPYRVKRPTPGSAGSKVKLTSS